MRVMIFSELQIIIADILCVYHAHACQLHCVTRILLPLCLQVSLHPSASSQVFYQSGVASGLPKDERMSISQANIAVMPHHSHGSKTTQPQVNRLLKVGRTQCGASDSLTVLSITPLTACSKLARISP
jgi:hypothetical protein